MRASAIVCSITKAKTRKGAVKNVCKGHNKDNFENEVMHSEKPVLLDFWAAWCGPCKMLSPLVDKYSEEDSSVKVGKVNVDEENELAAAFGISSIPALFVVKHGKVVASTVGYMPEEELKSFVASAKAK